MTQSETQPLMPVQGDAGASRDPQSDSASSANQSSEIAAGRERKWTIRAGLAAVLLLGCGLRAWLAADPSLGHDSDLGFFRDWTRSIFQHGIGGFYEANAFCDYPPLMLLVFYAAGWFTSLFSHDLSDESLLRVMLKAVPCLADVFITIVVYVEGRRLLGARASLAVAAIFLLNPVVLYNSAYWGQVDSLFAGAAVLGLVFINKRRYALSGASMALALLLKFQSIAFAPLYVFEVYRCARWLGVARMAVTAVAAAAVVLMPFAWHGVLDDVLQRSYVRVVGQYPSLSHSAYNVWQLTGTPHRADTAPPQGIVYHVARGGVVLADDASWMLKITWRVIALTLFAVVVAVILCFYSLTPNPISRFGAAGLLGLAFFLIPTQMHERYGIAALAFLPLWAVTSGWRERAYVAVSVLMLLNVAAILPADRIAPQIAGAILVVFLLAVVGLARSSPVAAPTLVRWEAVDPPAPRSRLIAVFRLITGVAVFGTVLAGGWLAYVALQASPPRDPENTVYLSLMTPRSVRQGWRQLTNDLSVGGGLLHLGSSCYLKGLGTHTPSRIVYDVPRGFERFEAVAGIDRVTSGAGSAVLIVELDGKEAFKSQVVTGADEPISVNVPLNGAKQITLRAEPTEDGKRADHVDWALARLTRGEPTAADSDSSEDEPAESPPAGDP